MVQSFFSAFTGGDGDMQNIPGFKSNTDARMEQRPIESNKPPIGVALGEIVINRRYMT